MTSATRSRRVPWLAAGGAVLVFLGCGGAEPRPLVAGVDACVYCRMAITDLRFGGEVVLSTGRHRTFDSIECLTGYLASGADSGRIRAVYVSDYERAELVDAASALFVRAGSVRSPMGRELAAFAAPSDTALLRARYGGSVMDWPAVRTLAQAKLTPSRPQP